MHPVDGLGLLGCGPGKLSEDDVRRDLQVEPDARRHQGAHRDRHVGIVHEGVDVLLTDPGRLVAAYGAVADPALGEGLLGRVHHVDVLGEEHHLADVAGQLRRVVRGQHRLRLTDPPHHGEDVLVGARLGGVLPFPAGDLAYQVVVDALDDDTGRAGLERALVPLDQAAGQYPFGVADGTAESTLELDRQVRHPAGRDVRRDVDLATPDDAEVDHGRPRSRIEVRLGRSEPVLLKVLHQHRTGFLVADPAEELPDREEVLDVIDQGRSGQGHQQRPDGPQPDPLGELQYVARPLGALVLDEVRLVHDHPAESKTAEPADVPVQHLVVDDDDVGETVDGVAVAVHHGGGVIRRPQPGLTRPVRLDDVRYDDEQGVGVRGLSSQQRLGRLTQAGLVRQQERPVPRRGRSDQLGLVRHQLTPGGGQQGGCRGEVHARRHPAGGALERPQQRSEQLPAGEQPWPGGGARGPGEVRFQEGVGQLSGNHGLRYYLALGTGRGAGAGSGRDRVRRRFEAGSELHLAHQRPSSVQQLGLLGEQREQGALPGSCSREDRGDPVDTLELFRPAGLAHRLRFDSGALLPYEQRHHLERRAGRGPYAVALHRELDVTYGLREHRDHALLVPPATATLLARRRAPTGRAVSCRQLALLCRP